MSNCTKPHHPDSADEKLHSNFAAWIFSIAAGTPWAELVHTIRNKSMTRCGIKTDFWSKMIFPSWFPTFLFSWMTAAAVESSQGWVSAELRILNTHHIHRLRRAELPRGWASPTKPNQHTFASRLDTHLSGFQSQSEGTSRFQDLYNELLLARGKVGQWPLYGILKWSSL